MRHRLDIDGLRAVAVIPVVLFHAGVSQVSGGFVGVDIFFVISGYLITSLIVGEMREGRFSLVTFYERRIRRIFPALFAVLAVCVVLAVILFMPQDLVAFGRSLLATALFVSNFHFYKNTDYFDPPPDTKPLLHTWSLAVEEQFYIVFPLVLMLAFRWGGRRWVGLILVLFVVSLAASIWVTAVNQAAAFYLAPMRVWELMLGALLAARVLPEIKSQALRELVAFCGIALIAAAVFRFSTHTPFPGWAALVPCLGAALLIKAGEDEGDSLVAKALSLRPMVFIGLISYSLYLWHWPLLVFARYLTIGELSALQVGAIVVASFALAALSWRYVEQPFRRKREPIPRRTLFASAGAAMGLGILFAGVDALTQGLPGRFSPEVVAIGNAPATFRGDKVLRSCVGRSGKDPCTFGAPVTPGYAVWGDSHALAMTRALGALAERHGQAIYLFAHVGCPPVLGVDRAKGKTAVTCAEHNVKTIQALESSPGIGTVILISRYAAYLKGSTEGKHSKPNIPEPGVGDSSGAALDSQALDIVFGRALDLTVNRLLAAGKTVVLVYPIPEIGFSVPSVIGRLVAMGRDPASFSIPFAAFDKQQQIVSAILDQAGNSERILRVYPHKRICDAKRCLVYANGSVLYWDDDHLSNAGATLVLPEFESIFEEGPVHATAGLADR